MRVRYPFFEKNSESRSRSTSKSKKNRSRGGDMSRRIGVGESE